MYEKFQYLFFQYFDFFQISNIIFFNSDVGIYNVEIITKNGIKSNFAFEIFLIIPPIREQIGLEMFPNVIIGQKNQKLPVARCYANGARPLAKITWRSQTVNLTEIDIHS